MNDSALTRARAGDHQAFAALTDPYRRELQLHCYRILGQVQDAEDAVQETLVSAWSALNSFEERSTLRSWLYRIATNRCLNMLRDSGRRPATVAGVPSSSPEPTRYGEVLWLEPYPDALLEGIADSAAGPEARYETREAVTLAFLTALHRLPPRQRAVLVLRDVLGFSATDVAAMLETTQTSVNSALIRARATIDERGPHAHDRAPLPDQPKNKSSSRGSPTPSSAEMWNRSSRCSARTHGGRCRRSLTGTEAATRYNSSSSMRSRRGKHPRRLIPTRANTQPAFGHYAKDPHTDVGRALSLLVLTLDGDRISHITRFAATSALPHLGLPRTIPW